MTDNANRIHYSSRIMTKIDIKRYQMTAFEICMDSAARQLIPENRIVVLKRAIFIKEKIISSI